MNQETIGEFNSCQKTGCQHSGATNPLNSGFKQKLNQVTRVQYLVNVVCC
jgi:hypothetical protein